MQFRKTRKNLVKKKNLSFHLVSLLQYSLKFTERFSTSKIELLLTNNDGILTTVSLQNVFY